VFSAFRERNLANTEATMEAGVHMGDKLSIDKTSKIFVAGHRGMVGSAVVDELHQRGYTRILTREMGDLDLRDQQGVDSYFRDIRPDAVVIAAAVVGGILANDRYPYQFLYDNLIIESNLINAAHVHNVSKVVFLGSSCIYPKFAPQPLKEEYLLTGELEPTNQWYALAKIMGVKMIEALKKQYGRKYVSLMPTNLYGPRDNFDLETSHVLPAMIRKFHDAKPDTPVTLWGTGSPYREFLHVTDAARSVVFALEHNLDETLYNVGTGIDLTIKELAELIRKIIGHTGEIRWDTSKPDGTPRKLMNISRLHKEGWTHSISLEDGIRMTYDWFRENITSIKQVRIDA
jgi:GDP-L-fucose synthase